MLNDQSSLDAGCLQLIIGPMFSGKTTKLMNIALSYMRNGDSVLCITHESDTRYGHTRIISHDKESIDAHAMPLLRDAFGLHEYTKCRYVCIEESQFFDDLVASVIKMVETDKKHVIVCGLDGTYERKPFANIMELVPLADTVEKLAGLCNVCGDRATFSKRLVESTGDILVGGAEMYMNVCRKHYLVKNKTI
jgi:thymidine kinase